MAYVHNLILNSVYYFCILSFLLHAMRLKSCSVCLCSDVIHVHMYVEPLLIIENGACPSSVHYSESYHIYAIIIKTYSYTQLFSTLNCQPRPSEVRFAIIPLGGQMFEWALKGQEEGSIICCLVIAGWSCEEVMCGKCGKWRRNGIMGSEGREKNLKMEDKERKM